EIREHGACFPIELEDRVERSVVAVDRAAAGRARATALVGPDIAVRGIDVDAGGRAPLPTGRKLTPIAGHGWRRVRQSLPGDRIDRRRAAAVRRCRLRLGTRVDVLGREQDRSAETEK